MDLRHLSTAQSCILHGQFAGGHFGRVCNVKLPLFPNSFVGGLWRFAATRRARQEGGRHSGAKVGMEGCGRTDRWSLNVQCAHKSGGVAPKESGSHMQVEGDRVSVQKGGHLEEYQESDFDIYPYVSVGLAGKPGEVLFEGVVKKVGSPQRGMRVVLRKMTGRRGRRWGQRALEVAPRLARWENQRLPFLTQLHGYVVPKEEGEETLTLVHGYYGSYSLHRWLLHPDWLAELESRLGTDKEALRRIGDERTGGPQVTRQLRVVRMVLRDVLTAVNFLNKRGIAHADLQLQNVHISAADRHVKVGVLGSAVDLMRAARPEDEEAPSGGGGGVSFALASREAVMAFDVKCVGVMMARMVLRELMEAKNFALLEAFMRAGHPSASLREYLRPMLCRESPYGSPGMQLLDRDGGAGWNLLVAMLTPKPSERISCANALRHPFLCGPRWRVSPSLAMVRWAVGSTTVRIIEEYLYLASQRDKLSKLIGIMERMNPSPRVEDWERWAEGTWRLVYHSGKHVGLVDFTKTQKMARGPIVRIGNVVQMLSRNPAAAGGAQQRDVGGLTMKMQVDFDALPRDEPWAHDRTGGVRGLMTVQSSDLGVTSSIRLPQISPPESGKSDASGPQWTFKSKAEMDEEDVGEGVDVVGLRPDDTEITMELDYRGEDATFAQKVIREVRLQIPREVFNVSELACCSYIDGRLLILRSSSSKALVFVRSPSLTTKALIIER